MTHSDHLWEQNAAVWTQLVRQGYDLYRDHLNTPAFLDMLPSVLGMQGLDIGCGEGHNTRLLAQRGASMTGLDVAPTFVRAAQDAEQQQPLGISYVEASAVSLPFEDSSFDFAISTMALMDLPEERTALREAWRALRPGGFLQFSIAHPCTNTPHRKKHLDAHGLTLGIEIGGYFDASAERTETWIFGAAPKSLTDGMRKFQIPIFPRTLSHWVNAVIAAGFVIEEMREPCPTPETVTAHPYLQDASVAPYFLHLRGRKPW